MNRETFSEALSAFPYAVIIASHPAGEVVDINENVTELLGLEPGEILGRTLSELGIWADPEDLQRFFDEIERSTRVADFETVLRTKSGERFVGMVSGSFVGCDGQTCLLIVTRDATDIKRVEEQLRYLSDRDPLTGLLNQRAFFKAASEKLATTLTGYVSVAYMDLDRLKEINDECGHALGDEVLMVLAGALKAGFRESDLIARLGGDEFVVLAVSREDVSDEALTARFLAELRERNERRDPSCRADTSIGIAGSSADEGPLNLAELIGTADRRMYDIKRTKRSRRTD